MIHAPEIATSMNASNRLQVCGVQPCVGVLMYATKIGGLVHCGSILNFEINCMGKFNQKQLQCQYYIREISQHNIIIAFNSFI